MSVWCRGVRGATTVEANDRDEIRDATHELLQKLVDANQIAVEDIASVIFTATPDLNADFPAVAARELGWTDTALMCAQEMSVPDSLPRCIRILIHWNTTRRADEIVHVYLRDARMLRPDQVQQDDQGDEQ